MNTKVDTAAVLKRIKINEAALAWFQPYLKGWPIKWAGSAPTAEMLMVPLLLGKRPGVEAGHIAMCLRPEGCTVQAFQTAFSCGPANNYRRALVKSGWFSLTVTGKPYAFTMTFTAKGEARLVKAIEQAALAATVGDAEKPAKAKSKAKGKAKGKKATTVAEPEMPASEPASPIEGQAAVTEGETTAPATSLEALAAHFNN